MGRLVGGLGREHCWGCFGVRQGVSSGLLNKRVHRNKLSTWIWWKFDQWPGLCCKQARCSQAELGVCVVLAAAAGHARHGGGPQALPAEGCLWTMSFLGGSRGSSAPGQTEAAVTHLHGSMCVSEYPNLCKAVPNLSTAFDYRLDLSHAAVKKTIHFSGIPGGSRQCQENLWTASWKQFYFR